MKCTRSRNSKIRFLKSFFLLISSVCDFVSKIKRILLSLPPDCGPIWWWEYSGIIYRWACKRQGCLYMDELKLSYRCRSMLGSGFSAYTQKCVLILPLYRTIRRPIEKLLQEGICGQPRPARTDWKDFKWKNSLSENLLLKTMVPSIPFKGNQKSTKAIGSLLMFFINSHSPYFQTHSSESFWDYG